MHGAGIEIKKNPGTHFCYCDTKDYVNEKFQ